MSKRKTIIIDEAKCTGCGNCASSCHESAIKIVNGKAKLVHANLCDGLGACIGQCPHGAITLEGPQEVDAINQWPVKLRLVHPAAQFLKGADLVICADCAPVVVKNFQEKYVTNKAVMIGCPKFDDTNAYQEKLQQIITTMAPASITVVRMEVPCCGGIARMVLAARDQVNPTLPVHVHTITTKGESNVLLSM